MTDKYPQLEIMIGEETSILRDMTDAEKADWDFLYGPQWTPEQIERMNHARSSVNC